MSETFPRWNLPEVNFVEIDPAKIQAEIEDSGENH